MKLHIPTSLRKALLTCMAAAMTPSFAGLAASGSFVASSAVVISLCAQQAEAALTGRRSIVRGEDGGNDIEYSGRIFTLVDPSSSSQNLSTAIYEYDGENLPEVNDNTGGGIIRITGTDLRSVTGSSEGVTQAFWNSFSSSGEYGQTLRFTESCTLGLDWGGLWVGGFIVESGANVGIINESGNSRNIYLQGNRDTGCNITAHGSMTFRTTDASGFFLCVKCDGVIRVADGSAVTLDYYAFKIGENASDQAHVIIKGLDGSAGDVIAKGKPISIATNSSLTVSDGAVLTTTHGIDGDGILKLNGGTLNVQASSTSATIKNLQVEGKADDTQVGSGYLVGNSYTIQNVTVEDGATLFVNSGEGRINGLKGSGTVALSGSSTHLQGMAGNTFTGKVSVSNKATLELGNTLERASLVELDSDARLVLSQINRNTILVRNGYIENASRLQGSVTLNMERGSIALEEMDAGYLHFEQNAGSVSGLKEGSTFTFREDSIKLGSANVTRPGGVGTDFVQFNGSGNVKFAPDGKLLIDIDADVAKNMDGKYILWISNGDISEADMQKVTEGGMIQFNGQLAGMVCRLEQEVGGGFRLLLDGNTKGIWYASKREDIDKPDWDQDLYEGKQWKGIYVDEDMKVQLDAAALEEKRVVLPHLQGISGKTLSLENTNTGSDLLTVELSNGGYDVDDSTITPSGNSEMKGGIQVVGDNVLVEKTGGYELTIEGNITSSGTVDVREGKLSLEGTKNSIGTLNVQDGASLTVTGSLTLARESTLDGGTIGGDGTLSLEKGLTLGNASLEGSLSINFNGPTSRLAIGGKATVGSLSGHGSQGSLDLGEGGNLTVSGANKSGNFGGALEGSGTITVTDNANQEFSGKGNKDVSFRVGRAEAGTQPPPDDSEMPGDNPSTRAAEVVGGTLRLSGKAAEYGNVEVMDTGKLVIGPSADGNSNITVSDLTLKNGSTLELLIDSNDLVGSDVNDLADRPLLHAGSLNVEKGSRLEIRFAGSDVSLQPDEDLKVRLLGVGDEEGDGYQPGEVFEESDLVLDRLFNLYYNGLKVEFQDDGVYLTGTAIHGNPFTKEVNTTNSRAGATLLWDARDVLRSESPDPTFVGIMDFVMEHINNAPDEASRVMSAVAGSTVTTLGAAQRDSMRRQLSRIRQHSNTLGLTPGYQYDDMPYYHTWIEGTGSYSRLKSDGDASGYKHEAWGGSFGIDADVTEHTSLGMAVTALYGDLDADACDTATGHLDSYYLSGIMRTQVGRWGHTLIVAGGIDRAKLDRTVNYTSGGAYATKGSTHGWSLGAVYEITYDIPMGEEHDFLFQPLVNLSYVRSFMKGYNESGSTAMNLYVDDQVWDTATLGVGARWIGSLGETVLERRVQVEFSAMVLQDMGDSRGSADVSLQAAPGARQTVYGAEYGRTSVQAGAALRVPVSDRALFYLNTDAEFRQGNTSWQASIGVRYDF